VKWREASGVLCDKRIPTRSQGKFYKSLVRPTMLCGSECWAVDKKTERRMSVAENALSGVTSDDGIRK